jgi:hypothetical protein
VGGIDMMKRFSFGVNLDDPWRYAGLDEPKSVIFPHLLSLSLAEGKGFRRFEEQAIASLHQPDPGTEPARASLALADDLSSRGVDFVRCWFPWRFFEPRPVTAEGLKDVFENGYATWPMDGLVEALATRGISVVPVLACGYQRMLPQGLRVDEDRESYVRRAVVHVRALVRHYRDKVKAWQIENEPNWWTMHEAGGWRAGASWLEPGGFRDRLLKALGEAVHEEDPAATTVINLEADQADLKVSDYTAFCDLVGLDFYPNYKSSSPVSVGVFDRAREAARESGGRVMVAETGYPSGPEFLGYTEAKQAAYVEAALRKAHGIDEITSVGIWRYLDTSWRSFPEQENHFGLVDEKRGPKAAWRSFGQLVKDIRG